MTISLDAEKRVATIIDTSFKINELVDALNKLNLNDWTISTDTSDESNWIDITNPDVFERIEYYKTHNNLINQ